MQKSYRQLPHLEAQCENFRSYMTFHAKSECIRLQSQIQKPIADHLLDLHFGHDAKALSFAASPGQR